MQTLEFACSHRGENIQMRCKCTRRAKGFPPPAGMQTCSSGLGQGGGHGAAPPEDPWVEHLLCVLQPTLGSVSMGQEAEPTLRLETPPPQRVGPGD